MTSKLLNFWIFFGTSLSLKSTLTYLPRATGRFVVWVNLVLLKNDFLSGVNEVLCSSMMLRFGVAYFDRSPSSLFKIDVAIRFGVQLIDI